MNPNITLALPIAVHGYSVRRWVRRGKLVMARSYGHESNETQ